MDGFSGYNQIKMAPENEELTAFEQRVFAQAQVLTTPIKRKPLILYIAALERSLGALLAQNNDEGKENALYYMSRTIVEAKHNYTPIENVCLVLVFATQKL